MVMGVSNTHHHQSVCPSSCWMGWADIVVSSVILLRLPRFDLNDVII